MYTALTAAVTVRIPQLHALWSERLQSLLLLLLLLLQLLQLVQLLVSDVPSLPVSCMAQQELVMLRRHVIHICSMHALLASAAKDNVPLGKLMPTASSTNAIQTYRGAS
jgi:hypothetical protein